MTHSRLLLIHALSPLHCGTGQSIGAVDLPIAREASTSLPLIPGSSLKGALRSVAVDDLKPEDVKQIFGPETTSSNEHAGGVSVGDARLLCLPVRSLRGTFAWVTSPLLLARLAVDCEAAGVHLPLHTHSATLTRHSERAYVCTESALRPSGESTLYFEDLDLKMEPSSDLDLLTNVLGELIFPASDPASQEWRAMFKARFCLVSDDVLMFFAKNALEFTTRVSLEHETKTVKRGQLWTEESLPSESLLVSLLTPTAGRSQVLSVEMIWHQMNLITKRPVQVGGNATVGRGRCRMRLSGAGVQA